MLNKYDNVMMETALIFSKESYATRLKVGAVLAKDGRVLLTGYNGTIAKTNNTVRALFIHKFGSFCN